MAGRRQRRHALPTPAETFTEIRELADPFYDNGPNDKGIGLQLWDSLSRVFKGFGLARWSGCRWAADRREPAAWQAANPVIQLLRPVSPLAWFPIWLTCHATSEAGGG